MQQIKLIVYVRVDIKSQRST